MGLDNIECKKKKLKRKKNQIDSHSSFAGAETGEGGGGGGFFIEHNLVKITQGAGIVNLLAGIYSERFRMELRSD